tara:strand:- start:92 stop:316 length:225 start_codon:yes stop_codon:yes gene_type:complete
MEYTYRDCLSEEIEILQLMLYRDEFLTLDPKACKHSGPLISKIEENMKELSELNISLGLIRVSVASLKRVNNLF